VSEFVFAERRHDEPKDPSFFGRILAALASALKHGLLGKSMDRFTGSDAYWDRVIAAQRGWPQKQFPER
jgi:hypothetical protein